MSDDERYRLPEPDMGMFGDGEPADEPTTENKPQGTMRFQDSDTTRPRPPTLAEQRARAQAEREQQEQAVAAQAAVEAAARRRRRVLIGGGVTIGVVAVIGAAYLLAKPKDVTAQCASAAGANTDTVVADQNCDPDYAAAHGGYVSNGFIFLPLVGGGFGQYHYYYGGGNVPVGQRVSGGSFTAPDNANVKTKSGKTIQRGGFGIGGKSGGSGGS
ncbi:MAG TPA: hypothetical protein VFX16_24425 [Pseudonocardiaceae bacterium]|nr:hypothetical protein [Pseudonocardiaceae bacterium]